MSNPTFTVSQTIASPGNEPVTIPWVTDGNEIEAASSVVQILAAHNDGSAPAFVRPVLLEISVKRTDLPQPPEGLADDDPALVCDDCGEAFTIMAAAAVHGCESSYTLTTVAEAF